MNRLDRSVLYIARFTLEARSALSIGTGGSDGVYDHPIVRDANELPMIPGTSLAGVLRHLWISNHGQNEVSAKALFGYQDRDHGEPSRLEIAACALQDAGGCPVEGLLLGTSAEKLSTDKLLADAIKTRADPVFRDRVRISHRGVAEKTGKFDRGLLLAGNRFSGEIRLWSHAKDDPDWTELLALLADPRLRLGGGTRAGLGALTLVDLHVATFDLRDPSDIKAFRGLSPSLGDTKGLGRTSATAVSAALHLHISLDPRDFWRIGQGDAPLKSYGGEHEPTLLPKREAMVTWSKGQGQVKSRFALVPGSSVKGALAHRTAFHWNALNGCFVEDLSPDEARDWDKSEHCAGVMALFGYAKDRETAEGRSRQDTGQAGQVLIEDVHLSITDDDLNARVQSIIHNSIDRFTGGVRNRMLFTEELLYKKPIDLSIVLLPGVETSDSSARRAFARALRDLCAGRLALGGGTTKGHGTFTGTPDPATEAWLQQQGETTA